MTVRADRAYFYGRRGRGAFHHLHQSVSIATLGSRRFSAMRRTRPPGDIMVDVSPAGGDCPVWLPTWSLARLRPCVENHVRGPLECAGHDRQPQTGRTPLSASDAESHFFGDLAYGPALATAPQP